MDKHEQQVSRGRKTHQDINIEITIIAKGERSKLQTKNNKINTVTIVYGAVLISLTK